MSRWGIGRRSVALAVAAGVALVGTAAVVPASATAQSGAASYPCRGYGGFEKVNPREEVDQDLFTWGPYGRTKVGNGGHDIDWRADPYGQDSWRTWLNSMVWTGASVQASTRKPASKRDPQAIETALAMTQDWIADNPYPWPTGPGAGNATHTRVNVMLCLRAGLETLGRPSPDWLDASLLQHAEWLKQHTWADHNVGTDQTLAILGIGCTLDRADLRDYAARKHAADITRVIDAQGVNNEQAIGYANYNYNLWGYVTSALKSCGIDSPAAQTIIDRRAALQGFLDYALKPDGLYHQLGDTVAFSPAPKFATPAQRWVLTNGESGVVPEQRVRIFDGGYVFGRSGWGSSKRPQNLQSAYALRFGPARKGHGHSDHTAITWNTLGRPILIDPGTGSYNADAWRRFYISPAAHNQLVVGGMGYSQPATKLQRAKTSALADFFQFTDAPRPGATRSRSIVVMSSPEVVLVVDKAAATKPTTFTQMWHLPHDVEAVRRGNGVFATAGGVTTSVVQLPVGGQRASGFGVVKGSTSPIQGWQWTDYFTKYPAPVATVTRSGTSAQVATAVVAAQEGTRVSVTSSGTTTMRYTITVGDRTAVVKLDPSGMLTRVK